MYKTYGTFSINEFSFHSGYGKIGGYVDEHVIENSVDSLLINPDLLLPNSGYFTINSSYSTINSSYLPANSSYFTINSSYFTINSSYLPANSSYTTINSSYFTANSSYFTANSSYLSKFLLAKSITDNCADYLACTIYFHSPEKIVPAVNHQYILSDNFLQGRHLNLVLIKKLSYE